MSLIILDRDGVINLDSPDFIKSPEEWLPIPGSLEAIGRLSQAGHSIAVATNQSGVGRGLYSLATLAAIHAKMLTLVQDHGGHIELVCFCPHHPDEPCACRKPKAGLFWQISQLLQMDLSQAIAVGDSPRDIEAARQVGCTLIGVKTGNGKHLLPSSDFALYDDLAAWVDDFLK